MGKALEKFAKKEEGFDYGEAGKQTVLGRLGAVGGVVRGSESGHKTAGFWGGSAAAAGAEAKNTKKSKLKETMAGNAVGTAGLAAALAGKGARGKAALAGAGLGAAGGALSYGLGSYFGKNYKADSKKEAKWARGEK